MSTLPALAALRQVEAIPSAAESWPCPKGCGGRTFYELGIYGQTVEACGCGYRAVITGRVVELQDDPRITRPAHAAYLKPDREVVNLCDRCGEPTPPPARRAGTRYYRADRRRRFCDPCKAIRLSEAGKSAGGKRLPRYAEPVPARVPQPCVCGCERLVPVHPWPSKQSRFATATCRRAAAQIRGREQWLREKAAREGAA